MDQALEWIGFTNDIQRIAISENVADFADMADLKGKDISDLAESFAKRSVADGRIHFGLARTKRFKGMIHWVQDFGRVSEVPTIDGLTQATYRAALLEASTRSEIRLQEAERSDTLSREAAPGKLKDGRRWNDWKRGMENMLATMPGVTAIPLSYVIRTNDIPEPNGHDNFVQKCIACAPLTGPQFEADARQVHQLIQACVQGEDSEQWIKGVSRRQNGRTDFQALIDHFEGEGNTSRRISEAERLRETLHYKSERALPFATFLSKLQSMFNIFGEEKEAYSEAAKLRALLEKVQHPQLTSAVSALRVQATIDPTVVTFTTAANHLAAQVSTMPEYIASKRSVSFVGTASASILGKDGSIFTGHYKNWKQLSKEDRDKVTAERAKNGTPKGAFKNKKRKTSAAKTTKKLSTVVKELEDAKRSIAALKSANGGIPKDEEQISDDAGNAFGGRSAKKAKGER
jgi:hypothetical protein